MKELIKIPAGGGDAELAVRASPGSASAAGSPLVILYLHGFGSSQDGEKAAAFRRRAESAGIGFVSLDFQGHGLSGGEMRGLSLSRCLRDVERVRRHLPALRGPVAVMGSSMGALVALWHAAEPAGVGRVASQLLIAPALGLEATLAASLGEEGMESWRRDGVLEVTNELGTFELGWEFVADQAKYPTSRLAALHATPALIFQGKLDDRVSWREVADFAGAVPRLVRLELIEDGDHRLIDQMDRIWAEGLDFVVGATSAGFAT